MPIQDVKVIEWSQYDDRTVKQTIEAETDDTWDFYTSVDIHAGRVDLVFVDRAQ